MILKLDNGIEIGIRSGEPSDVPFLFNSWCRQIRTQSPFDKFTAEEFRRHKHSVIEPIVQASSALIAHDPSDAEHIYGYCVFSCGDNGSSVLHAIYVKGTLRGYGIGSALLREAFPDLGTRPVWSTYRGQSSRRLTDRYGIRFDPYRVIEIHA